MNLSFLGCKYSNAVKLNRSLQLDLLDLKSVCIIEANPLAAALFLNPTFAPCFCHTTKLAFKLGLKTNRIKNGVVKKRIETIRANKTIGLFDKFLEII